MIKFGGYFASSISVLLLFLFIGIQVSDAVRCQKKAIRDFRIDYKECSACVHYECFKEGYYGVGCPEDFYEDCHAHSKSIKFIQDKNPLKACFHDGQIIYVSGCENEAEGAICMHNNKVECEIFRHAKGDSSPDISADNPYWNGTNGIYEGVWKISGMILLGWIFAQCL